MTTLKRDFVAGNYYHVYSRGNSKQKIFLDEADKNRFVNLLYLCNGENKFQFADIPMKKLLEFSFERGTCLVEICAWVLMSNHFHLLIFIPENGDSESISKFMARLLSAYLNYFNIKYKRTGGLFEGRFQSIFVDNDYYLKYLFSYIHLNPLKMLDENWKQNYLEIKKANIYLEGYKYSSFHDLVVRQKRHEKNILTNNSKVQNISEETNSLDKLFSLFTCLPGEQGSKKQIV